MLLPAASLAFGAIDSRLVKHLSSASGYYAGPIEVALRRLGKRGSFGCFRAAVLH